MTGLILTRLHGPGHYETLKRRYAGEFADLDVDTLARANRLITYLDQPDPLGPAFNVNVQVSAVMWRVASKARRRQLTASPFGG